MGVAAEPLFRQPPLLGLEGKARVPVDRTELGWLKFLWEQGGPGVERWGRTCGPRPEDSTQDLLHCLGVSHRGVPVQQACPASASCV